MLRNDYAQEVDGKLLTALKLLTKRKNFWHISQTELLIRSGISRELFQKLYGNKYQFLEQLNQRFIHTMMVEFPIVVDKESSDLFQKKLSLFINAPEKVKQLKQLLIFNEGEKLPSFQGLDKQLIKGFNLRLEQRPKADKHEGQAVQETMGELIANTLIYAVKTDNLPIFFIDCYVGYIFQSLSIGDEVNASEK
ncbi:hypothetical protein [Enterococcus sp. LJL51]|uniref:hypothetical protein n=1 Tax=Enterococcus sp. LJL51 TaxID=3416656 RepID=UPI003CF9BB7F